MSSRKSNLVKGEVKWAEFAEHLPPFALGEAKYGRKRLGIIYERKVHKRLNNLYGCNYMPNPWIVFGDSRWNSRWCQPDGLLLNLEKGIITIVECKYQHTARAWWQMFHLYQPVVAKLFGTEDNLWRFATVEVVKWFDPSVNCPSKPVLVENVHLARPNQFCVHIFRP